MSVNCIPDLLIAVLVNAKKCAHGLWYSYRLATLRIFLRGVLFRLEANGGKKFEFNTKTGHFDEVCKALVKVRFSYLLLNVRLVCGSIASELTELGYAGCQVI